MLQFWPLSQSVVKGRTARAPQPISGKWRGRDHCEKSTKMAWAAMSGLQFFPSPQPELSRSLGISRVVVIHTGKSQDLTFKSNWIPTLIQLNMNANTRLISNADLTLVPFLIPGQKWELILWSHLFLWGRRLSMFQIYVPSSAEFNIYTNEVPRTKMADML